MSYTIKEVAKLSGVSVRTLHYYDEIGLLKPAYYGDNSYRYYEEEQMLRLQQILFYREFDFQLGDIQSILMSGSHDQMKALHAHKLLLHQKAQRIHLLMDTIDKTIEHLKGEMTMSSEDMYLGFDLEQQAKFEEEIRERYGDCGTDSIKESKNNTKHWKKADYEAVQADYDRLHKGFTTAIEAGKALDSPEVKELIGEHYKIIQRFYTPTKEVYIGMGNLYVDHPDFKNMYDAYHPQLAEFLRDAMKNYAERVLN